MKSSLRQTATPQHRSRPRVNDRPHPKTRPSGQHPRRQFLRLAVGAAALPAVSCDPERAILSIAAHHNDCAVRCWRGPGCGRRGSWSNT